MTELLIGGGVLTVLGIIASFVTYNNKNIDTKTARVYERLDQVKEVMKGELVSKDVCKIFTAQFQEEVRRVHADLAEIKADIKKLIERNGS